MQWHLKLMACNSVIGISKSYSIEHLMGTYLTLHVYVIGARADTVHNMVVWSGGCIRLWHWVQTMSTCFTKCDKTLTSTYTMMS